jgi:sugar phosphate isomerase/epimerase
MHRLSLAHMTVIGLTPPEIVMLAADLGCAGVSLNPGLATGLDVGGPVYRLDNDPAMRRATARALADTGVTLDLVEAIIMADIAPAETLAVLDVFAELGATEVNVAIADPDQHRASDHLSAICEFAGVRSMTPMIEFFRSAGGAVPTLAAAVAMIATGKYPGLRIMVDALHLARSNETPADLAAIDPALIGGAQLCDAPAAWPGMDAYFREAVFDRRIPGEGELPLAAFLEAIPSDVTVSPEVPLKSLRDAGVPVRECARRVVEATRCIAAAAACGSTASH